MPARPDISDKLIHFTRGESCDHAFARLQAIIRDGCLIGASRMIRGSYRCVCFTEAPLPSLASGFVNPASLTRYSPFGVMFDKAWIFARGGRPVIYQPDDEFSSLPEEMRWRHVRYEPLGAPPIDFTWEREWRISCEALAFSLSDAAIVLPDDAWAALLVDIHDEQQDVEVQMYSTVFEREIAEQLRTAFPWRVVTLS